MKIQRVWAKNLYGNLTFDISLNSGINLLVGINGSGKTSMLNIIDWLTSADIPSLAITEYDEVGIEIVESTKRKLKIYALKEGLELNIHCISDKTTLHPINVSLRYNSKEQRDQSHRNQELREEYSGLGPEKNEIKLWKLLRTLPQPLTISLDRKITVTRDDLTFIDDSNGRLVNKRTARSSTDPMTQVGTLARQRYSQYQTQLIKLNDTLKAKVIASTFATRSDQARATAITLSKINAVEHKLMSRMSAWTAESNEQESVKNYFNRIRTIISNIEKAKTKDISTVLNSFLSDDMHRITALADAFDEFESKAVASFESIQNYLKILNSFFKDSNKKLIFSEQNSQLYYQTGDNNTDLRNINVMSSGERQILILLTYIAFSPQISNVFVIDEPELSLHPKWQHQLLPSIDELMGKNTQMIIATHSPEIVGNYQSKCVQL